LYDLRRWLPHSARAQGRAGGSDGRFEVEVTENSPQKTQNNKSTKETEGKQDFLSDFLCLL